MRILDFQSAVEIQSLLLAQTRTWIGSICAFTLANFGWPNQLPTGMDESQDFKADSHYVQILHLCVVDSCIEEKVKLL